MNPPTTIFNNTSASCSYALNMLYLMYVHMPSEALALYSSVQVFELRFSKALMESILKTGSNLLPHVFKERLRLKFNP